MSMWLNIDNAHHTHYASFTFWMIFQIIQFHMYV